MMYNIWVAEKSFDDIRRGGDNNPEWLPDIREARGEYWMARELQEVLSYSKWENFDKIIKQAMISCRISQQEVGEHFVEVERVVISGKGKKQRMKDYVLTRYACYLIVMNGDPRKEIIAKGQTYFAVKTREQELRELYSQLTESERRLFLRGDIKQKNMLLAEVAKRAGISTTVEYGVFQDHGYSGLYGGEGASDIANRKGLDRGQEILDYMGSEELGANLFRITQTEALMRKNEVDSIEEANATHYKVGKAVRETIKGLGTTLPEDLPLPEKSIQELQREQLKQIKDEKSSINVSHDKV